jgi:hypothetical protein
MKRVFVVNKNITNHIQRENFVIHIMSSLMAYFSSFLAREQIISTFSENNIGRFYK